MNKCECKFVLRGTADIICKKNDAKYSVICS